MTAAFAKLQVGVGWWPLIDKIFQVDGRIIDVKEKFGKLRIEYYGPYLDVIENIEEESIQTCEVCGWVGQVIETSSAWMKTRCERHLANRCLKNI